MTANNSILIFWGFNSFYIDQPEFLDISNLSRNASFLCVEGHKKVEHMSTFSYHGFLPPIQYRCPSLFVALLFAVLIISGPENRAKNEGKNKGLAYFMHNLVVLVFGVSKFLRNGMKSTSNTWTCTFFSFMKLTIIIWLTKNVLWWWNYSLWIIRYFSSCFREEKPIISFKRLFQFKPKHLLTISDFLTEFYNLWAILWSLKCYKS